MDFIKNEEEPMTPEEPKEEGMGDGAAEPTEGGDAEAGETAPEETTEGQM